MRSASAWRPYALAVVAAVAAVALTRYSWPLLAAAPFVFVFSAVAAVTHWGSGRAGLLAAAVATGGLAAAFAAAPGAQPFGWRSPSLAIFGLIAVVGNRLIDGRNRAVAALRANEAELRATLAQMRTSDEQLRHAHKMKAVGQLAAGVAHNFNNLLQVTMGYVDVLNDSGDDPESGRAAIAEIRGATERGAALTRQLMAFTRQHESRAQRVSVDRTIDGLRDMLDRVVREDIDLRLVLDAGGAAVTLDPYDLEQVVINLVINGRDALPDGGNIGIYSAVVAGGAPGEAPPGAYVRVRVIDNGVGMPPEVQARLFEPFFTTKEVGEGAGLGLAFVHGVAQHAGGYTTVESAPGKGTTVSVFFPVTGRAADAPAAAPAAAQRTASRAATILLVEDEPGVRATTQRILTRAGHRVLTAANAEEASALFDRHATAIDVLVTDVVMPGVHGPELASRLVGLRPSLRVVFVSGYSDQMPALTGSSARAAFVPKPFTAATLLETIDGMVAGGAA